MRCPVCGALETRVIETRSVDDGKVNRRRLNVRNVRDVLLPMSVWKKKIISG